MDDVEILYQTYLVTFATASALRRSGNRARFASLVRDVDHRSGAQKVASQLAVNDATDVAGQIRTRKQVIAAIVGRTANAFHCAPAAVYAMLDRNRG